MPKPKSPNETLANFRVDRDKWRAFIDQCAHEGLSASEKIKTFIDGYLSGTIDTTPTAQDPRVADLEARMDEIDRRLGKWKGRWTSWQAATNQRQQISRFFKTTSGESPKTN